MIPLQQPTRGRIQLGSAKREGGNQVSNLEPVSPHQPRPATRFGKSLSSKMLGAGGAGIDSFEVSKNNGFINFELSSSKK